MWVNENPHEVPGRRADEVPEVNRQVRPGGLRDTSLVFARGGW